MNLIDREALLNVLHERLKHPKKPEQSAGIAAAERIVQDMPEYELKRRFLMHEDGMIELIPESNDTLYGYTVKELAQFARSIQELGVTEKDIKNFLRDECRVYTTLRAELMKEMQEIIDSFFMGN